MVPNMIRALFWILLGAVTALQVDRWLREQRERLKPSRLTGTLLDKTNERLERNRRKAAAGGSRPTV
ncbi:hypothetical protein BH18ACT15_BH18ACT15_08450 [soil metagenome]